ncbi:outer membrane beta-barrel protein [Helicobacter kayseriensis]|uniref:outer membrane beta-barrel protein n=1 Tax=Helicobacter kayseriensis TaxID=2905877 RepID=UPI001E62F40C|nr:outer membrane beta-barrel protein [Helicobacter kayseriensis]MCE3047392.1 outer membrane beta-barrel protein [Helicobacter kayseriensis]MCE3048937.1 outer membrane beta-barrel protein [Helicobacter kayseriensis]
MKRIITLMFLSIVITNGIESKSGMLIGIEGNLEGSQFKPPLSWDDEEGWIDLHTRYGQSPINDTSFSFNGGIKLGYQHYFTQSLGLRASGYFGLGSLRQRMKFFDSETNLYEKYDSDFLLIKTGLDLEFLWDFWEMRDHALGLNLGVGYRYTHFGFESGEISAIYGNDKDSYLRYHKTHQVSSPTEHSIYPSIGLHYYYQAHQFALNYRFGGVLHFTSEGEQSYNDGTLGLIRQSISSTPSYFSFSYAYRF